MPNFIPGKPVQKLVEYLSQDIESIRPDDWLKRRKDLARFQTEKPDYSIVMIARNEERYLFASLASISEQKTDKSVELILVNNGSTDRTKEIAERLGVKVVDEFRPGWAEARQAGLKVAKGEIVLSADGDNLYNPDWVDKMLGHFRDPEVVMVCSQYSFYTFDNRYPLDLQLYQNLRWLNSKMRHAKRPHLNCLGGSLAYRADIARELGGFTLGVGRGEDGDLAFRMQERGKIIFDDSRKAFSHSSLRNVLVEESLFKTLMQRLTTHLKRIPQYLSKQKH
ncbi:glycosyltransferase family 2 protein [Croceimicrobium sp.]|uniref:glycosyltransferase family 2 protein n=1 Tax=Croceimicrobium sp. TaxID=2828340 RepID=UPI003BA96DF2